MEKYIFVKTSRADKEQKVIGLTVEWSKETLS